MIVAVNLQLGCRCCCRITVDVGLWPIGRSWHTFTPITSGQIFLYGGFTNDQVPLGKYFSTVTTLMTVPLGEYFSVVVTLMTEFH